MSDVRESEGVSLDLLSDCSTLWDSVPVLLTVGESVIERGGEAEWDALCVYCRVSECTADKVNTCDSYSLSVRVADRVS